MKTTTKESATIASVLDSLGISTSAAYVPHKTKDDCLPALRWSVSVRRNGYEFHRTNYEAGVAYAPSHSPRSGHVITVAVARECETGYTEQGTPVPPPSRADVVHCLLADASDTDGGFEAWADEYGYDSDSRAAERIYRACCDVAAALRLAFTADELQQLNEAFAGY